MTQTAENPLLAPTGIADFPAFRPEHVGPGVAALLEECEAALANLEGEAPATWKGLVEPIERLQDRVSFVWGLVSHMMSVRNTQELREVYEEAQPKVIAFLMRLGQSRAIFDKLVALRDGAEWGALDGGRQRAVRALIHDAELSGVGLDGAEKERFNELRQELSALSTRFDNNVLDSTKAFQLDLTTPDEIEGLPASALALYAQTHPDEAATPEAGPWRVTLSYPSFGPFLQHSRRRDLRETVWKAFVRRATEGALDNEPLIRRILSGRKESAGILGYGSWAEVSLSSKMAPDVAAVEALLEELRVKARPAAERELAAMAEHARAAGAPEADELMPWDRAFWSERLREARYDYTDEELRPYFPLPKVLKGMFALADRLFGVRVEDATGSEPGWHEDVRYFVLRDHAGEQVASFFMDPYSRPADKRGGAWMNDGLGRTDLFPEADGRPRLPVAYIVCNFTPPVGARPALLTFSEVETLFHEFGHALQHMLTRVDCGLVAGISNVEWDAVELPSQFMENWCYHEPTVQGFARHFETDEPLPKALFDKIVAARTFNTGIATLRQLQFGLVDLELHHRFDPDGGESLQDAEARIEELTRVGASWPEARQLNSFSHIFAGGYSAGYYSYKWAEVLSADAFAAFEEAGLEDEASLAETGRRFVETVLGLGGSQEPMEVFKAFRGREPSTEALMRHTGLVASS
jgi:oligopeptidase A